jgi:hypothetical protein
VQEPAGGARLSALSSRLYGGREKVLIFFFPGNAKPPMSRAQRGFGVKEIGGDLLSHTVSHAVPSALKSLTSVFGMGTGGSSSL